MELGRVSMPRKKRMSWRQLYNSCTIAEQREMINIMFTAIETRQAIQMRLIEIQRAHYLREKRKRNVLRMLSLQLFLFVLATVGITSWLIALHTPPSITAPVMALNLLLYFGVVLIKPKQPPLSYLFAINAK